MSLTFHFLRPWWGLALIPLGLLFLLLWKKKPGSQAWSAVCDAHLLPHLLLKRGTQFARLPLILLFLSALLALVSLAGPAWHQLPSAIYKTIAPKVLVLSMSANMLEEDLAPNRLSRAKFKLLDLLGHKHEGQFAFLVYTSEPFVVSPLTEDAQTIAALLPSLSPEIMPVTGDNLESALTEAQRLIRDAGYQKGEILVLTANAPSMEAIHEATKLAQSGLRSSILAVTAAEQINPLFRQFAEAGRGLLLRYSSDSSDLDRWLANSVHPQGQALSTDDFIPLWRDEGPWFLLGALILFLPVFRRGWLERILL